MSGSVATRNEPIGVYRGLVEAYGFVPNLFAMQKELPRVVEAEQRLIDAIAVRENRLNRRQKDWLLLTVASVRDNDYCRALHAQTVPDECEKDSALFRFALKLAKYAPWFCRHDVDALRVAGFEFAWVETTGPYLQPRPCPVADFRPYAFLREQFGFVPNLFKEQMLRPDVVEAEVQALEHILITEDLLSHVQKENILLVVSAANVNTYCVAVHTQILSALGVPLEDSDQIVEDYHQAGISPADVVLLDEVRKLCCPAARLETGFEAQSLRAQGFTEAQIIEAVAMAAFTNFLNSLQAGLGAVPDFPPRRVFGPKDLYRFSRQARPTSDATPPEDPDATFVARVQNGDTDAFEELVRRHSRQVFGTLAGIVGNMNDARDATQEVFLKAFEHIGRFQGRSKFSTWLTSIAINTGAELLRQRKPSEPLEEVEDEEGFRPRQIQSWADNPEQLLAASQRSDLVRQGVLRLPHKYRIAVLLRDINQFSTEEAAAALGLSIPALKARLLRGRLMLRESLAPYFIRTEKRSPDAQLR